MSGPALAAFALAAVLALCSWAGVLFGVRALEYVGKPGTMLAVPGPPAVMTKTETQPCKPPITDSTVINLNCPMISGMSMAKMRRNPVQPSTWALSSTSREMPCRPAM